MTKADSTLLISHDEIELGNWTLPPDIRCKSINTLRRKLRIAERINANINKEKYNKIIPGLGVTYQVSNYQIFLDDIHNVFAHQNVFWHCEVSKRKHENVNL